VTAPGVPTMGVEEEFFLVDPVSRTPQPAGERVVKRALGDIGDLVSGEFTQLQLEVKTPPCADAGRLRAELVRLRAAADAAATAEGVRLCASGTPVLTEDVPAPVGDHPRYRAGLEQYRAMIHDFSICSLHVHIHLPDPEVAVAVSNHLRPWLPLLVALSANSPFHQGKDTGYADWRAVIRSRFPCLGPPPYAESLRHHEQLAAAIADSGAMLDAATPFWDVRLNPRLPTLEVRTMDVTADVDDTVALAVLIRALVTTATATAGAGDPGPRPSSELLRAAYWRAARDGWSGRGVDALTGQILRFPMQAVRLVDHIAAALHGYGDMPQVTAFMDRLAARGTGAEMQRASLARRGDLIDVVDDLMALTART
jgi:glutamate---cysteine ligase / carboxylate-amine ligase